MEKRLWRTIVSGIKAGHVETLRAGFVLKPQLHAFADGKLLGYIQLRPVRRGEDARTGIAEMSGFAAAARADEIVVAWETQDVAVACDLPARHEGAGLNIVRATAEQRILYPFTYREQQIGLTDTGLASIAPQWTSSGAAQPATDLEPAIAVLLEFSFRPVETGSDNLFQQSVALLESQEYRIRLTA
ncbi:hypothetical protein CU254_41180 (plasmid) [Amycolatopsis sp. AA4]|uniref:hypothetical protein n=1 Tax=Actinomycetes TaxID=1760 RepID=UPI0001B55C33|nr:MULTISPECIES: hypothetical protein [Actinomycetes]ATY17005.1 hypothetical protein CU254_41180 [Amycolatopsis sp. AA4]